MPGDARLFVELRDLATLRRRFRRLGIWNILRQLSDAAEPTASTQPWHRRAERVLGLTTDKAVLEVLGRRAALIAPGIENWQEGVLLAELPQATSPSALLRRWRARSIGTTGDVRRYALPGDILLAVRGRTFLFGPPHDPDGLWARTVDLLAGRKTPSLAARSEFVGLRSRLGEEGSGLAYAAWGDGTAADGRSSRVLIGFSADGSGLRSEFLGRVAVSSGSTGETPCISIDALPATTIGCWSFAVDRETTEQRSAASGRVAEQSLIGMFLGLIGTEYERGAAGSSGPGPQVMVVLDAEGAKPADAPQLPHVSLIWETREAAAVAIKVEGLARFFAGLAALSGGAEGRDTQSAHRSRCEDVEISHIDIGPMVALRTGLQPLAGVQVCWAVLDGRLVLSSSREHVVSIIRAARGKAPTLGGTIRPPGSSRTRIQGDGEGVVLVERLRIRGDRAARMLSSWLAYAMREHPEAINGQWWRDWARSRLRQRASLGLGLRDDPDTPGGARVVEVDPLSSASGLIRTGDVVVEASGKPLPDRGSARAVADRYGSRGDDREFVLSVRRRGETVVVRIPVEPDHPADLAGFDPPSFVRRAAILLSRIDSLTLSRHVSADGGTHARLEVIWARPGESD